MKHPIELQRSRKVQNVKTKNGKFFLNPKLEMKTLNLIQHEYMMFLKS